MKRSLPLSAALFLAACATTTTAPETDEEKTLYAVGLSIARNLESFDLSDEDLKLVEQGLRDGIRGEDPYVDAREYASKILALRQERVRAVAATEEAAATDFLDRVASEDGAVRTDSGLVFVPLREGSGASPEATDTVEVHYHGTLVDGTVFDSSVERGRPATFALNRVIPCWTEGLQRMKEGGKARLVCPASIAYGDRGAPPKIKPGATLVFEVELLDVATN